MTKHPVCTSSASVFAQEITKIALETRQLELKHQATAEDRAKFVTDFYHALISEFATVEQ